MHDGLYLLLFALYSYSFAVVWVVCGPSGVPLSWHVFPIWHFSHVLCVSALSHCHSHKPTNHKVTVCSSDRVAFFVLCLNWFQNQSAVSSTWHFTSSSHTGCCCGYLNPAVGARAQVSPGRAPWPVQLSCGCPQGQGTLELVSAACAARQHWEDPGR